VFVCGTIVYFFEKYLQEEFYNELPVDGIMLLQQYIQSPQNSIIRCEFVDSKFLYAVRVNTSEGFELCPADNCSIIQNFKTKFEIIKEFNDPILKKMEKFVKEFGIEICGIEIIADAHGKFYAYDVNTNTNYNSTAEKKAFNGPLAMPTIAKFLINELEHLEFNEEIEVSKGKLKGEVESSIIPEESLVETIQVGVNNIQIPEVGIEVVLYA